MGFPYRWGRDPPSTTGLWAAVTPNRLEVDPNPANIEVEPLVESVMWAIGLARCSTMLHGRRWRLQWRQQEVLGRWRQLRDTCCQADSTPRIQCIISISPRSRSLHVGGNLDTRAWYVRCLWIWRASPLRAPLLAAPPAADATYWSSDGNTHLTMGVRNVHGCLGKKMGE